ncbi:MAG: PAS domain S-box protein [Candidatus Marinimicrobia bacterium]|jgi:PAS domain S-box-containing protein|nr:PAS domain S-box protein [Candidatus Neomarinimicrobiota bacterium]MBT3683547.1 PAS domain S-box protein [Candidatus Neomarinimicrobiota bacterium]MBT4173172.1 PAS domain S-box protein [Candidatus Neomarinimicrobiota bacterium]MBT4536394.1 PAS domain S-box protein [Candidatus Neomarinimicrobiota bacterium]MBT4851314.1 PAS domain S-box protein [Candidatus Neomarinimicrobiota bacterium]
MTSQDPKQSQAEKKLHDSENMFRILFETSQNAIFIMKENFFIECNQNSLEMFKCEHGDIIGHTLMEFSPAIQPDGTDSSNKAFAKIDAAWKGEPQLFEWQHKKFDGTLFDTEIRLNLIQLSTGPLILATVKDFTDHKIVENALSDSQNKYKTLFQKSADAILIIEGDKFVDCNDATVKMLKYDNKAELLETHPSALSPPRQPDGRDSFEKANEMMSIAIDHGSHRFEWDHKRKDGEVFPVEVLLTSVPLPEGHFIHVVWRDITLKKQDQINLEKALEDAKQGAKIKSLFLANISHEIRTPLNSIIGYADLLKEMLDDRVGADEKEFFDIIDRSGQRLIRTVHEILDMSQMDTQSYNLNINEFDLSLIVQQAITELTPRIKEKNLTIDFYSEIKNPILVADEYCITQAVSNIIDNAIKYTNEGGLTIWIDENIENTILVIKDTGIGISKVYLKQVFDIFSQESAGYSRKYEGLGLGLALTKRYLEVNNAEINIDSIKGAGTKVTITFPKEETS